jgi:hypothetical protein
MAEGMPFHEARTGALSFHEPLTLVVVRRRALPCFGRSQSGSDAREIPRSAKKGAALGMTPPQKQSGADRPPEVRPFRNVSSPDGTRFAFSFADPSSFAATQLGGSFCGVGT